MASLSFHGAAGTVTGSRFLVEAAGRSLLFDCGLFQGLKELRLRNWDPPAFAPEALSGVVLTHAHIDHTGWLPRLGRLGFRGPVWCTPGTADLASLLLRDSASIQEEDAEYANRKGYSKHRPALPLYTVADAEAVCERLREIPYGVPFEPTPGFRCRFVPAGHLLGSAQVECVVSEGGASRTLLFSGDVGRYDAPLVPDPAPPPACDLLVVESTYGDRTHPQEGPRVALARLIRDVVARRGTMLIPAFAVGRAQQMIWLLRQIMEAGEAPEIAIHVDSPMAVDATAIYRRHPEEAGLESVVLAKATGPLFGRGVYLHSTREESLRLNALEGPRIILSSSGMLAGGRVLHHLRRLLPEPQHMIVLAGFQAIGTRGRALRDGARFLRMHGAAVPVRAQVAEVPGMSGHADADELLRWLRGLPQPPARTCVVHGEPDAAAAFALRLGSELGHVASVARHEERIEW
ncbi:MAG: MBL fold metallo-hydrolase [Planctomycetes bacterium]|nr:MBL fold metallo-hydrolase [Planctomycetota bacterium]